MSTRMELRKTHTITGTLVVETGLHVGAGKEGIEIGGMDSPIVKHPHSGEPYIPGSSLKGKLRSLLEWALDCVEQDGSVWGSDGKREYGPSDPILRTFGVTHKQWKGGPTRLVVRDAHLDPEWVKSVLGRGLPLTEEKTEVVIDRIQGKAKEGVGPRRMERVPAGARFPFEMLFKEYAVNGDEGKTDRQCLARVFEALRLLEQDALGGSGSRGYGRVKIHDLKLDGKDVQGYFESIREVNKDAPNPLPEV